MSISGFSNSPRGEDPLSYYEGDPYRVRAETGVTSGRVLLRRPDRCFQANGEMAPQMTYGSRNERGWVGGGEFPHKQNCSYHPEHPNSGYQQSLGHPSNSLGCPNNHADNIYLSPAHPENTYPSPGHPNKSYMNSVHHDSSFTSSRRPESVYPPSEFSLGHPNNVPGGQLNSIPHENGFREVPPSHSHPHTHCGPPPGMHTAASSHHPCANGPQLAREFWQPLKPHPPLDHAHRAPRPIHNGKQPNFRPLHTDSKYRPDTCRPLGSNYRTGPDGPNFRPRAPPGHTPESYWPREGYASPHREWPPSSVNRTQPGGANWEGNDPRFHPQRRGSDTNPQKNFITAEERRHSYLPHDRNAILPLPYSPSISSQSSWSPSVEDTGSPSLRMPLPSPSTPDDSHTTPDLLADMHPHCSSKSTSSHLYSSAGQGQTMVNERSRDLGALRALPPDGGRILSPGGKGGREERWPVHPKGPEYYKRRTSARINGLELGGDGYSTVRDPRQAGYSKTSSRLRYPHACRVLQEHTYSKKYMEGCEKYPLFCRVRHCSDLNPEFLTPLQSSMATRRGGRRISSGPPTTDKRSAISTPSAVSAQEEKACHSKPSMLEEKACHSPKTVPSLPTTSSLISTGETDSTTVVGSTSTQSPSALDRHSFQAIPQESESSSTARLSLEDTNHAVSVSGGEVENSHVVQGKCKSPVGGDSKESVKPKAKVWCEDEEKKGSDPSDVSLCSPDGFRLDLDPEPTSGSNSNSTCCSESEEMTEEKAGDSDMDVEGEGEGVEGVGVDATESSSDESVGMCEPGGCLDEKKSPDMNQKWTVSLSERGKMCFSRLDNIQDSPDSERLHLKQMTSNRIQLRNGRILPASSLAFLAASQKNVSPPQGASTLLEVSPQRPSTLLEVSPQRPSTLLEVSPQRPSTLLEVSPQRPLTLLEVSKSPSSTNSSPGPSRLRRSKRLAGVVEEGSLRKEMSGGSTADSDSVMDREDHSFEIQLSDEPLESSDESEFEMPDFEPVPLKLSPPESPQYKPPNVSRPVRGRRRRGMGRGRGRGGRRGGKRGGVRSSSRAEEDNAGSTAHGGVQFYVHEPRTREEDGVLQRRRALELEVKRNERLQSEHCSTTQPIGDVNAREDDRCSEVSGSMPASNSSLDSLHHLQSSSKASSTDFSADLIARVKKISTARSSGDTPLHKCCRTGKYDMVRYLLLVENSPVNIQDNAGWTPLHEATSNGHTEIAELLLQHGADTNASARDGTRPIHDAIEIGCFDMVKLLIDHQADLMVEYGERTAVEFAMDQKQIEIGEYIKEVIRGRQETKKASIIMARNTAHQKTTPTRTSKKDKFLKQAEEYTPCIPVSGYGPGCVSFGEELDFPLFFVSPIVELSSRPHLPVYNFQISPLGTSNPRRHNFYFMDDLLETLQMEESEFIEKCHEVNILELSVAEFLHRMKAPYYNLQVSVPEKIKCLPGKRAIKFVPLCQMLSHMLDIVTENMNN